MKMRPARLQKISHASAFQLRYAFTRLSRIDILASFKRFRHDTPSCLQVGGRAWLTTCVLPAALRAAQHRAVRRPSIGSLGDAVRS